MDFLKDLLEKLSAMDKKLDLNLQEVKFELIQIKEQDAKQNSLLAEHAKRSDQLEKDNNLREKQLRNDISKLEKRVDELSIPLKLAKYIQIFASWLGGVSFAALTILELIKLYKK